MTIGAKPPAEVTIDPSLVRALLQEQHADLAHLPLNDFGEGWDNRLFRLGEDSRSPTSSRRFGSAHRARAAVASATVSIVALADSGTAPCRPSGLWVPVVMVRRPLVSWPKCAAGSATRTLRRPPSLWDSFFARCTNPRRAMLHTTRGEVSHLRLVRVPCEKHLRQVDGLVDLARRARLSGSAFCPRVRARDRHHGSTVIFTPATCCSDRPSHGRPRLRRSRCRRSGDGPLGSLDVAAAVCAVDLPRISTRRI